MKTLVTVDPTAKAVNAAAFVVRRLLKLGPVESVKVQRLLYYANAWHLANTGDPLFIDDIRAWGNGPVVVSLSPLLSDVPLTKELSGGDPEALTAVEHAHVEWAVDTYGGLSGYRLSGLTRKEQPWIDAWESMDTGDRKGVVITPDAMRDFYRAQRAELAATPHT